MEDLNTKLTTIQVSLIAPKSQKNSFGNYNYRSCEDILNALKPHLKQHGLSLILVDELVNIGDRYYIKATAILSDGKNEAISTAYAREAESKKGMDEAQITGSASSYARKYALNALFAIDDTKDADTQDNSQPDYMPTNKLVKVDQVKQLLDAAKEASGLTDKDQVLAWFEEVVGMKVIHVKQFEFDEVLRHVKEEATTKVDHI